jgi:hypothetical protein
MHQEVIELLKYSVLLVLQHHLASASTVSMVLWSCTVCIARHLTQNNSRRYLTKAQKTFTKAQSTKHKAQKTFTGQNNISSKYCNIAFLAVK